MHTLTHTPKYLGWQWFQDCCEAQGFKILPVSRRDEGAHRVQKEVPSSIPYASKSIYALLGLLSFEVSQLLCRNRGS